MLAILGNRQQELLKLLLRNKEGLTVVELSARLGITRNAVRQHVVALQNEGLVALGGSRPSGGRPEQLYLLTAAGKELFPRQYFWFAQLVVESIRKESGADEFRKRLGAMGAEVAKQLRGQHAGLEGESAQQKVEKLSGIMEEMGYGTGSASTPVAVDADGATVIEADNCIFHNLAMTDPEICQFDLALLSTFTDSEVVHQECMARGGNIYRFRFTPRP